LANSTEFGLARYFCSRDIGRIYRVAGAQVVGLGLVASSAWLWHHTRVQNTEKSRQSSDQRH
jgi:acyl-CoA reductase-like NAD-dependent aldehyde dehydrogenase